MRAGFHPLQMLDRPERGVLDVGAGYRAEWLGSLPEPVHGPYAELGAYPVNALLSPSVRLRWGGYGTVDAIVGAPRPFHNRGLGGTLGTLLEITGHGTGTYADMDEDGAVLGAIHGQWAVGVFASAGTRRLDRASYQNLIAGISFRVPFTAGIVCCVWPGDSDDDDDDDAQPTDEGADPPVEDRGRSAKRSPHPWRLRRSEPPKLRERREYVPAEPRRREKEDD